MRATFGLLFLTLSIFGCAASEPAQCIKGQYNLCRCATGQAGTQLCVDGFSISDCECLPSAASSPGPTPDSPSNPTKPQPPDPNKRWVFVTETTYQGDFWRWSLTNLCEKAAKRAGIDRGNGWTTLAGVHYPYEMIPSTIKSNGPWHQVSPGGQFGDLVFKDRAAIGALSIVPGTLSRNEYGGPLTSNLLAWYLSGCADGDRSWSQTVGRGSTILVGEFDRIVSFSATCDQQLHLICLEQ